MFMKFSPVWITWSTLCVLYFTCSPFAASLSPLNSLLHVLCRVLKAFKTCSAKLSETINFQAYFSPHYFYVTEHAHN